MAMNDPLYTIPRQLEARQCSCRERGRKEDEEEELEIGTGFQLIINSVSQRTKKGVIFQDIFIYNDNSDFQLKKKRFISSIPSSFRYRGIICQPPRPRRPN